MVFGLMPAQAGALVGEGAAAGVGSADATTILDSDTAATATDVYIDVTDDLRIVDHTKSFTAQSVHDALEQTDHRLYAQVAGGSGVAEASWTVRDADGAVLGTFATEPDAEGTCALPLAGDATPGALRLTAPGFYECTFTATDRSKVSVETVVAFFVLASGESSEYEYKTVYEQRQQTFDGVYTYAEPSATGLFHQFVLQLGAVQPERGSEVHGTLARIAADYATAQDFDGAYEMLTMWQLAAELSMFREGDPVPFAGSLSVVVPIPADADEELVAGDAVTVFRYGADGVARTPLLCTVRADRTGQMYVEFETTELGAFGVARYHSAQTVTVIANAVGNGTINYPGRTVWDRSETPRYVFTPVTGHRLASLQVVAGDQELEVPATVGVLGYYNLDLSLLSTDVERVLITATFEAVSTPDPGPDEPDPGPGPDDPDPPIGEDTYLLTTEVVAGAGSVYVNDELSEGDPFEFGPQATIWLTFSPQVPSQRVQSAQVVFEGDQTAYTLAVFGTRAVLYGLPANAHVSVAFDSETPPEPLFHTVTMSVAGGDEGHGSIDSAYDESVTPSAERVVREGEAVTFTLHPQSGYCLYTVMEGNVEMGGYVASSESQLTFTMPAVYRDHAITVSFKEVSDHPFGDEYVNIVAEGTVDADALVAKPPIVTPPSVVVPKGEGYTFAVIPADENSVLSKAWVKPVGSALWTDITAQVNDAWTLWPEEYEGAYGTGYYALQVADVQADTFVRVSFRDATAQDDPRPPTPTRNVSISVSGSGGTVSPNTMGAEPLKVPVGKSVQVTIIRQDGHHLAEIDTSDAAEDAGSAGDAGGAGGGAGDVAAAVEARVSAQADDADVLQGGSTFTIPDRKSDQAYTFVFAENEQGGSQGPGGNPGGNPGGDGNGGDSGSNGGTTKQTVTITPVGVAGSDGKVHGTISPGAPVQVVKGDSFTFTLKAEAGYRVSRVEANGAVLTEANVSSIQLQNVQVDTELRVSFAQKTAVDSLIPVQRSIKELQSLAATGTMLPQTGDATGMLLVGLVGCALVALLGVAVAFLARRRSRDRG